MDFDHDKNELVYNAPVVRKRSSYKDGKDITLLEEGIVENQILNYLFILNIFIIFLFLFMIPFIFSWCNNIEKWKGWFIALILLSIPLIIETYLHIKNSEFLYFYEKNIDIDTIGWKYYFTYGLFYDIIACFPIELIFLIFPQIHRLFLILLFFRFLLFNRLFKYFHRISLKFSSSSLTQYVGLYRIFYFILLVLFSLHFFACLWFFTTSYWSDFERWQLPICHRRDCYSLSAQYLLSFYWCTTTLLTVGYGDITPITNLEVMLTVFVMLTGLVYTAIAISMVISVISGFDTTQGGQRRELAKLKYFMQRHKVSKEIRSQVISYFDYIWIRFWGYSENQLLQTLPIYLRSEIVGHLLGSFYNSCPFFQDLHPGFFSSLCKLVDVQLYPPESLMAHNFSKERKMIIFICGTAQVKQNNINLRNLSMGDSFGAFSLFLNEFHSEDLYSTTFCETFILSYSALAPLFEKYPQSFLLIQKRVRAAYIEHLQANERLLYNLTSRHKLSILFDEEIVSQKKDNWVILPGSRFSLIWDVISLIFLFLQLFILPYQIAYSLDPYFTNQLYLTSSSNLIIFVFNLIVDIFFFIDLVLHSAFFSFLSKDDSKEKTDGVGWHHYGNSSFALRRSSNIVVSYYQIFLHYLHSYFILDLLSILPLDYIFLAINGFQSILPLYRINRFLRIFRLSKYFSNINVFAISSVKRHMSDRMYHALKYFLLLLLVFYFLGFFWTLLGFLHESRPDSIGWRNRDIFHHFGDEYGYPWSFDIIFYHSFLGSGDIVPATNPELIFSVCIMFGGMFLMPNIIGLLSSTIENLDVVKSIFEDEILAIKQYFNFRHLPSSLLYRILRYHDYKWSQEGGINADDILSQLPPSLSGRLKNCLYRNQLLQWKTLNKVDEEFIFLLCSKLRFSIYPSKQDIYIEGQTPQSIYYLQQGLCHSYFGNKSLPILPGRWFGLTGFINRTLRQQSSRSDDYCTLIILNHSDLEHSLNIYPQFKQYITEQEEKQKRKDSTIIGSRHSIDYHPEEDEENEFEDILDLSIYHPHSGIVLLIDLFGVLIAIYNSIMVPFRIAFLALPERFEATDWTTFSIIDYFLDFLWICDMVFHSRFVGFFRKGKLISNPSSITKNYFKTSFLLDFLCVFPLELITLFFDRSYMNLLRINRILRFFRIFRTFNQFELYVVESKNWMKAAYFRLIVHFLFILMLAHWLACVWFLSSYSGWSPSNFAWHRPINWVHYDNLENSTLGRQYLRSIYFSVSLLMVTFCGDIIPTDKYETLLVIIAITISVTIYASFIANVAALVTHDDNHTRIFFEKRQQLDIYLKNHHIPLELQQDIREHYNYIQNEHCCIDERKVFQKFPSFFRQKISSFFILDILDHVPLFSKCSQAFKQHLCVFVKPQIFLANKYIQFAGHKIQFFFDSVSVIDENGKEVCVLGPGSYYAEESLIYPALQLNSLLALTYVHTFILTSHDIQKILLLFPDHEDKLRKSCKKRSYMRDGSFDLSRDRENSLTIPSIKSLTPLLSPSTPQNITTSLRRSSYDDDSPPAPDTPRRRHYCTPRSPHFTSSISPENEEKKNINHGPSPGFKPILSTSPVLSQSPSSVAKTSQIYLENNDPDLENLYSDVITPENKTNETAPPDSPIELDLEMVDLYYNNENNNKKNSISIVPPLSLPPIVSSEVEVEKTTNSSSRPSSPSLSSTMDCKPMLRQNSYSILNYDTTPNSHSNEETDECNEIREWTHVDSNFRFLWDSFCLLCLLYYLFVVPFDLCFLFVDSKSTFYFFLIHMIVNYIIDIVGIIDIIFRIFYFQHSPRDIATNDFYERVKPYLWAPCILNLLASFPLDLFFLLSPHYRYACIYRLVKLFRLKDINIYIHSFHIFLKTRLIFINFMLLRVIKAIFAFFLTGHWFGCIQNLTASIENSPFGWIYMVNTDTNEENNLFFWWLRAIYWVFTTITALGYGDIHPHTNIETIICIFEVFFAAIVYSLMIGSLTSFWASQDKAAVSFHSNLSSIKQYCTFRNIPTHLIDKIHSYYIYLWNFTGGADEDQVLNDLPFNLRFDVIYYRNAEILENAPMFIDCDPKFISSLNMTLRPVIIPPDTYVYREGEIDREMYFVNKGSVNLMNNDEILKVLGPGKYFGELSLFSKCRRMLSVKTVSFVECFILGYLELKEILRYYPQYKEHFVLQGELLIESYQQEYNIIDNQDLEEKIPTPSSPSFTPKSPTLTGKIYNDGDIKTITSSPKIKSHKQTPMLKHLKKSSQMQSFLRLPQKSNFLQLPGDT